MADGDDKKKLIEVENAEFAYKDTENDVNRPVLKGISLQVERGSYVAVLGPNGSGKSTLAKLINILELPDSGNVFVFGLNTKDEDGFWEIRSNCSCVFQNPDNQIIGTIVEEDVAFGPENLGVKNPELRQRVDDSLRYVGLEKLSKKQAANLSGGQKQKLAIAGALAMDPAVLILDESTAMLDPNSRDELLELVERLRKEKNVTVITITHDMYEASRCDEVIVLCRGEITSRGTPAEVFADRKAIFEAGLDCPTHINITQLLAQKLELSTSSDDFVSPQACAKKVCEMLTSKKAELPKAEIVLEKKAIERQTVMSISHLSYSYDEASKAIDDINLEVYKGEVLAIVGRSGCGKTTLITHMNAILRPQSGSVNVYSEGKTLTTSSNKDIKLIRQKVGLVFQYPEYQLFEETVYKDIAFGLKKMGLSENDKRKRIHDVIKLVGLDESILSESPFDLSGGQKRRVAMAGVLVMKPDILVLDEPASGLDPQGRRDMFRFILELKDKGVTVILVSHNMDEASEYADRICCIKDGKLLKTAEPRKLFEDEKQVVQMGIACPKLHEFMKTIQETADSKGLKLSINTNAIGVDEAINNLFKAFGGESC